MLTLIELYSESDYWKADAPLTLIGIVEVKEIHAQEAANIYGHYYVKWFNGNTIELI